MSGLLEAVAMLIDMIRSDATDGLVMAAEVVEQRLFNVLFDNGMHIENARQWAKLITRELME